jgi:RNA polymerase sigma factor (sigma-70 family)
MSTRLRAWFQSAPIAAASPQVTVTDGELVRRFADSHDDDAFAELVRRHGPMVLATCRRALYPDVHTADDAFQATFLVLATKAAVVHPPERVGAWLHGVAFHVARKARAWARKAGTSAPADLARIAAVENETDPDVADTRAKIDSVLAGMPSKYRAAVVLCDLEQRSRTEAAAALGWSEGSLSGRLARARKLLADRLLRRGVTVPAAGLGVLLPASAAMAIVPVQLAASTVQTAVLVSSGAAAGVAGGAIPASIAALAQGVPTVHSATFKLLAAGITGVGLALGGFGLYALTAAPLPQQATPPVLAPLGLPAAQKGWATKQTFAYKSAVTAVVVGSDVIAAGDKDGDLVLWDARTGKEKEKLLDGAEGGAKPIEQLQISPDGAWLYLVTSDRDNYHQCSVAKQDRLFPGAGSAAGKSYGVTPDGADWLEVQGKRILVLKENRFAENIIPFLMVGQFNHKEDITFVAACDEQFIGTVAGGVLRQWTKGKDKPLWETKLEKFEPSAMAACPQSKVFVLGGTNGEARVYFGVTGKLAVTCKGHSAAVTAIAVRPDGKRIVTGSADKTARVYDAETGQELALLKGHTGAITSLAFAPDGEMIVSGSADKTVRVWQFKK